MGYHVRVKVCGITTAPDLREAVRAGADAVGLNFHSESPRYVPVETAATLLRDLPPFITAAGVFVQKTVREVGDTIRPLDRIRVIQVHGGTPEVVDAYPYHFVPAFAVRDESDRLVIVRYLDTCRLLARLPAAILVDGHAKGLHGGTGQKPPWDLLADWDPGVPLILAGGLTPENVGEAVRMVRPWSVDVASGVESRPGRKDPEKMRRFVEGAREAGWRM
jgi:phosphoribosylanthranilate isomerase